MKLEELSAEIKSVLATIDRRHPDADLGLHIELHRTGKLSGLERLVASDPDLSDFSGKMRAAGRMAHRLTAEGLAFWLVSRALATDVQRSLEDLNDYLRCESFPCNLTVALANVVVDGPVDLGNGMSLVPFSEGQFFDGFHRAEEPGVPSSPTQSISSALQVTVAMPKLHYESGPIPEAIAAVIDAGFQRLEMARLCVGLVGPCVPFPVGDRFKIDPRIPLSEGGMMSHGLTYSPGNTVRLSPLQCAEAAEVHVRFLRLSQPVRDALKVPATRLESAMAARNQIADSAIDLGIALEALFLSDNELDELTYRLSVRGARFLKGPLDERRALRKTFADLYKLRSKAVHRGVVDPSDKFSGKTASDLLLEGYGLVATAIKAVIHRGQMPDWEEVVLN